MSGRLSRSKYPIFVTLKGNKAKRLVRVHESRISTMHPVLFDNGSFVSCMNEEASRFCNLPVFSA